MDGSPGVVGPSGTGRTIPAEFGGTLSCGVLGTGATSCDEDA